MYIRWICYNKKRDPNNSFITYNTISFSFYCAAPDVQAYKASLHLVILSCFFHQTDSEFVRLLGYRFENNFYTDDDIRDIYSGQEYRKLMHPGGFLSKDNPSICRFSFNTDGVSPFRSSNRQNFWPIFLVINELPPRLR